MAQSDVFHLGLTKADLQGATLAIVPGDPERVKKIAALMDNPVHLASHREFTTWRAELSGKPVIICSTGIGGPSTSIAVEELSQLGVRTFLRVGTTGAIQPDINVGDVLVTTGSVRLDGASLHFAPLEFLPWRTLLVLRRWSMRLKRQVRPPISALQPPRILSTRARSVMTPSPGVWSADSRTR